MSGEREDEVLDPRVQIELERLNASSEDINKLENKLEEANALFRSTLSDSTANLKLLSSRLGAAVEKARPYYEAREAARRTQLECQKAAVQFQRASVLHQNARETIQLAEERFLPQKNQPTHFEFDNAWQEMLNHATMKLMEAEKMKINSESEHLRRANNFANAQKQLKRLERTLERSIGRARPYFEQREVFQQELLRQKTALQQLQWAVGAAKARYSASLRELENISEEIHLQRRHRDRALELVPAELDTCDLVSVSAVTESATSDYEEDFKLSQEQQYWADMRQQIETLSAALPAGVAAGGASATVSESPRGEALSAARLPCRRHSRSDGGPASRRRGQAGRRHSLSESGVDGTGPEQSGVDSTGPEQSGVDGTGPEQSGVDVTGPEQSGVDGTGPEQSGVDGTGPEQSGVDGTGLEQSGADGTGPEQSGVDGTGPEQSGVDGTGPEQSGVDGTGPEQSGVGGTGPEQSGVDGTGPEQSGVDGTGPEQSGVDGSRQEQSGVDGTGPEQSGVDGTGLEQSGVDGSRPRLAAPLSDDVPLRLETGSELLTLRTGEQAPAGAADDSSVQAQGEAAGQGNELI